MSSTKTTGDNTVSHTIYFAQCHTCQLFAKVPFFLGGGGQGGREGGGWGGQNKIHKAVWRIRIRRILDILPDLDPNCCKYLYKFTYYHNIIKMWKILVFILVTVQYFVSYPILSLLLICPSLYSLCPLCPSLLLLCNSPIFSLWIKLGLSPFQPN